MQAMITTALEKGKTQTKSVRVNSYSRTVGVFVHHRDAKVALEDLQDAGFPLDWVTLISRDCLKYSGLKGLHTRDRLDKQFFNSSENCWQFFQRLFRRGKYIVAIEAPTNSIGCAEAILTRRRGHGEVWHL